MDFICSPPTADFSGLSRSFYSPHKRLVQFYLVSRFPFMATRMSMINCCGPGPFWYKVKMTIELCKRHNIFGGINTVSIITFRHFYIFN